MKNSDNITSTTPSSGETPRNYTGYEMWKGWKTETFFRCSDIQRAYFKVELSHLDLRGKHVLEIGFGNGTFLCFARACGAELYGTEVLDSALALAQQHGVHRVVPK